MATIKAIEAKSVHQIQSGQVIVDLCSVVKELVENGLDAGATALEVRFKNNGLDSIEVQDNGVGISSENYESVALKHHTSKLSSYDDLSSLQTFGFRGEALSSLCALSKFHITTAQAHEAPKGNRLDFDRSGRLKGASIVASQKGTTACVEDLFEQLPVRRKELTKNIKREYGKVIGLLHAYACICINVKFSVKNSMPKAKTMTVFATNANTTTRDNIANVYGAKTLSALVAFDLDLDFQPTLTQMVRNDSHTTNIVVRGHISKPVFGEGRQTPDRQMFFVNGRPCGLPQVAKAINEVYKGFNVSQSPFIFADFQMDTNAYDVNVSPDKRTILLHNSATLIEKLKTALVDLFEKQDQTVPQSHITGTKLPSFKQLNIQRREPVETPSNPRSSRNSNPGHSPRLQDRSTSEDRSEPEYEENMPNRVLHDHFRNYASTREEPVIKDDELLAAKVQKDRDHRAEKMAKAKSEQAKSEQAKAAQERDGFDNVQELQDLDQDDSTAQQEQSPQDIHVRDFNQRMAEQLNTKNAVESLADDMPRDAEIDQAAASQESVAETPNTVQDAFHRTRPQRSKAEVATITIGDRTITKVIGTQLPKSSSGHYSIQARTKGVQSLKKRSQTPAAQQFSQKLRKFGVSHTSSEEENISGENETSEEEEVQVVDDDEDSDQDSPGDQSGGLASAAQAISREGSTGDADSDLDFVDEAEKKAEEEAKVAALIKAAEESAAIPTKENVKRANKAFKSGLSRDSTLKLSTDVELDLADLLEKARLIRQAESQLDDVDVLDNPIEFVQSEEERLSLTVSKKDFPNMHIIGQFNLGFILAVRPRTLRGPHHSTTIQGHEADELFIIDQHASDEKYNFERLQLETVVGNQHLVRPLTLGLTAVEEEVVIENLPALEKNGFIVEVNTSGDQPVGQRCKLLSLPLSKEVVFDTRDLEELIHLLGEWPAVSPDSTSVPRPTKVRKMFAMRACRSSIMIGKTLSKRQMRGVLEHMGSIDKPWNCPHGRPTMRHLTSLKALEGWREGDGVIGINIEKENEGGDVWTSYIQ